MMHRTDGGTPILYPALKQFGVASEMSGLCKSGSPKADDGHNGDPLAEPNPCPCQHRLCPIVKMLLTPALTSGMNLSIIFI